VIAACVLALSTVLGAGPAPSVTSGVTGLLHTLGEQPPAAQEAPRATGEPNAFIEVCAAREVVWLHEPVPVTLRFGFEREFLERQVIQPFQRQLDVPAQLHASWSGGTACARLLSAAAAVEPTSAAYATFVLEDDIARARRADDQLRSGRTFAVFEHERMLLPTCAGELTLAPAHLRFAYATRFRNDAFGERTPEDRRDEIVTGQALVLKVQALPEAGRPADFTGAVGRFRVHSEAAPRELVLGESLKLVVAIEGEGDLEHFGAPRLEPLDGLRQQGWVEQLRPGARRITYDLAAVSELAREIPAIRWSFFDPGPPAGYRTVATQPIPITVRAPAARPRAISGAKAEPAAPERGRTPDGGRIAPLLLGALGGAALLLLLGAVAVLRSRRRKARLLVSPATDPVRARAAAEQVRARAAAPGVDLAQALAEFLAARLACPVPAVIAPDLPSRLTAAGIPREEAARAAKLLDELVAARYGGGAPLAAPESTSRLVEALDLCFQAAGRAG